MLRLIRLIPFTPHTITILMRCPRSCERSGSKDSPRTLRSMRRAIRCIAAQPVFDSYSGSDRRRTFSLLAVFRFDPRQAAPLRGDDPGEYPDHLETPGQLALDPSGTIPVHQGQDLVQGGKIEIPADAVFQAGGGNRESQGIRLFHVAQPIDQAR